MRLSCADYTWPRLDHRSALQLIANLGIDAVDIGFFWGASHIRPEEVVDDPSRWVGIVAERTQTAGLAIADVFLTPGPDLETRTPNHPDPGEREASLGFLRASVELACGLGAPGITLLPGIRFDDEPYEAAIERASKSLRQFVDEAGERGLALSFEPHSGSCVDTPARAAQLCELTPGLTITLDPSHFLYEGVTTDQMLVLVPHVRHVQLRAAAPGVMQARMADNEIDLEALIGALADSGYGGYLAMEYVWITSWGCDRVDNISETAQMRDAVTTILARR